LSTPKSFTALMNRLRAGDDEAAARVFGRFAKRLVGLARSQLDAGTRGHVDPEDIVQSVYRSFFTRYERGEFELTDWDGLWGMLTVITVRKCLNRAAYFRTARRDVRRQVPLAEGDHSPLQLLTREPTPDEAALLMEIVQELMADLDGRERTMLSLSLQGYTVKEISPQVERSERTVQRLLERVRTQLHSMQTPEE
jgi:RNA polymerase sigma-70 factor (ECF subfamily)